MGERQTHVFLCLAIVLRSRQAQTVRVHGALEVASLKERVSKLALDQRISGRQPLGFTALGERAIKVAGAMYDLETAKVEFFV